MSYALYIYLADPEFPADTWESLMADLELERAASRWSWAPRATGDAATTLAIEVSRVDPRSALAPPEALWCVHVRTARSRGPLDAWRQLAIAYRALATLPRVEICDPERWYPASPQRFRDPRRYYDHARRIIGHLAVATELIERGFLSPRGELRLDPM